eukprot:1930678-Pleurochrysis_carterae.AAC.1
MQNGKRRTRGPGQGGWGGRRAGVQRWSGCGRVHLDGEVAVAGGDDASRGDDGGHEQFERDAPWIDAGGQRALELRH